MLTIIFANGDFVAPHDLSERLASVDLVIAADGGSLHCRALNITPDVIIGDLDSIDVEAQRDWQSRGVQIFLHPVDKDQTDLELALLHAQQAGAQSIFVLGALGRRWDHSMANVLLLAHPQFDGLEIGFLHGEQRMFLIRGRKSLDASTGDNVSLIPLGGAAVGVTTRGLKFPLNAETLTFGSSRGVSNVVISNNPEVEVQSGILLCVTSPTGN